MNNTTTNDYPCGLPPDFPPSLNIPLSINYIQGAIALLTGIIGFTLNVFVLFIIVRYRALHHRLMFIAVQIVIVELVYSLLVPPAIFVSSITRMWVFGEVMCNLLAVVNDAFAIFRFMMTLILALDRFISVFMPFFYQRNFKRILSILLNIVYVVTFFRVLLPLTGILSCNIYVSTNKICTAFSSCSTGCYYFVLASIVLIILTGVIIPLFLYTILFSKAYMIRRKTKHLLSAPQSTDVELKAIELINVTTVPEEPDGNSIYEASKRQSSIISTDKSTASLVATKSLVIDNLHVTITMFILLMSVIGCTAPAFTLYFVQVVTLESSGTFFILIMLLGRTSFNSIPVFDAIVILRDRKFRKFALTWIRNTFTRKSSALGSA